MDEENNLTLSSNHNHQTNSSFHEKSLSFSSPNGNDFSTPMNNSINLSSSSISSSFYRENISRGRDSNVPLSNRDTSSCTFLVPGENIENFFLLDGENTRNLEANIIEQRRYLVDSLVENPSSSFHWYNILNHLYESYINIGALSTVNLENNGGGRETTDTTSISLAIRKLYRRANSILESTANNNKRDTYYDRIRIGYALSEATISKTNSKNALNFLRKDLSTSAYLYKALYDLARIDLPKTGRGKAKGISSLSIGLEYIKEGIAKEAQPIDILLSILNKSNYSSIHSKNNEKQEEEEQTAFCKTNVPSKSISIEKEENENNTISFNVSNMMKSLDNEGSAADSDMSENSDDDDDLVINTETRQTLQKNKITDSDSKRSTKVKGSLNKHKKLSSDSTSSTASLSSNGSVVINVPERKDNTRIKSQGIRTSQNNSTKEILDEESTVILSRKKSLQDKKNYCLSTPTSSTPLTTATTVSSGSSSSLMKSKSKIHAKNSNQIERTEKTKNDKESGEKGLQGTNTSTGLRSSSRLTSLGLGRAKRLPQRETANSTSTTSSSATTNTNSGVHLSGSSNSNTTSITATASTPKEPISTKSSDTSASMSKYIEYINNIDFSKPRNKIQQTSNIKQFNEGGELNRNHQKNSEKTKHQTQLSRADQLQMWKEEREREKTKEIRLGVGVGASQDKSTTKVKTTVAALPPKSSSNILTSVIEENDEELANEEETLNNWKSTQIFSKIDSELNDSEKKKNKLEKVPIPDDRNHLVVDAPSMNSTLPQSQKIDSPLTYNDSKSSTTTMYGDDHLLRQKNAIANGPKQLPLPSTNLAASSRLMQNEVEKQHGKENILLYSGKSNRISTSPHHSIDHQLIAQQSQQSNQQENSYPNFQQQSLSQYENQQQQGLSQNENHHRRGTSMNISSNNIPCNSQSKSSIGQHTTKVKGGAFAGLLSPKNIVTMNGVEYLKLDVIGKGGSSKVFRVLSGEGDIYALKQVRVSSEDEKAIASFSNEITLLKKLAGHPSIIRLVDATVETGSVRMVLELGEIDLSKLMQETAAEETQILSNTHTDPSNPFPSTNQKSTTKRRLPINFVRLTWEQMLRAVHCIHEERIVHGDLKPANFVLVRGRLKLIDFGIARSINNDTTNIVRECQVGTLNYMSPEAIMDTGAGEEVEDQSTGTKRNKPCMKVSRASDVWSLGCILYQMEYGRTPFADLGLVQKISCIVDENYPIPIPKRMAKASEYEEEDDHIHTDIINSIILSCLERNPSLRPPIAGDKGKKNRNSLLEHQFVKAQYTSSVGVNLPPPVPRESSEVNNTSILKRERNVSTEATVLQQIALPQNTPSQDNIDKENDQSYIRNSKIKSCDLKQRVSRKETDQSSGNKINDKSNNKVNKVIKNDLKEEIEKGRAALRPIEESKANRYMKKPTTPSTPKDMRGVMLKGLHQRFNKYNMNSPALSEASKHSTTSDWSPF